MPFIKGQSGNPGGRQKGALTNMDVAKGIIEGLKRVTDRKEAVSAITAAIKYDIDNRRITRTQAVELLAKFMPKDVNARVDNLADLIKAANG